VIAKVYGDFGDFGPFLVRKTNPILSFSVLRAVYCEKVFEKTKPICRPSAGNTKHEALNPNELKVCYLKKQSQF
jgi:hypothetical protein